MESFEKMRIGERLRYMLEVRKVYQSQLAEQCGITQSAISNIMTDASRKPSAPTLLKLAGALQCSPEWLMTGTGDPYQSNTLGAKDEQQLIELFRKLTDEQKWSVITMLQALSDKVK